MATDLDEEINLDENEQAWKELADAVRRRALIETGNKPVTLGSLMTTLREEGLLTHAETWAAANYDEGEHAVLLAGEVREILAEGDGAFWTTDSKPVMVASTRAALDGVVLTHRVTQDEIDRGAVGASDLSVLDIDCMPGEQLAFAGGGEFGWHGQDETDPSGVYRGPESWLDMYQAGDLLAFQRRGNTVSVQPVDHVDEGDIEAQALRNAFDQRHGPAGSDEIPYIAIEALATDSTLFRRAVPPVTELLERAGLVYDNPRVGRAGESWERPGDFGKAMRRRAVVSQYRFDPCCQRAFNQAIDALEAISPGDMTSALRALTHEDVLHAFLQAESMPGLFPISDRVIKRLLAFGDNLCEQASLDDERAAALTVLGSARELAGNVLGAAESFAEAVQLRPNDIALAGVATIASARGHATEAHALLRRFDAMPRSTRAELAILDRLFSELGHIGRNEPCPCGSGKKYKACCLPHPALSVDQREMWFLQRLVSFTTSNRHTMTLNMLMMTAFGLDSSSAEGEDRLFLAITALLEDTGLASYVEMYSDLLDDVDRELTVAWRDVKLQFWDVTATHPAQLLDPQTSEVHSLVPGSELQNLQRGIHVGYVRQTNHGLRVFGPLYLLSAVEQESAQSLLAEPHSATDIAKWFGSLVRHEQD